MTSTRTLLIKPGLSYLNLNYNLFFSFEEGGNRAHVHGRVFSGLGPSSTAASPHHPLVGVSRGNTTRGNRARSSEENGALRGSRWGCPETSGKGSSQRSRRSPLRDPQRPQNLSEPLRPAPNQKKRADPQDDGKGGLSLRGGASMWVLAVLTVLSVLESTLPSFCWSYKVQHNEATVAVLTVLAVSAVIAVSFMTATPLKLNPPFPWPWDPRVACEPAMNSWLFYWFALP